MTDEAHSEEAKDLGRRLKALREKRPLSQEAVAAALEISRSAVSDIERGIRAVSAFELGRLSTLYEQPLEALLYGEPQATARPWDDGAVYSAGRWHRLPAELAALADTDEAYGVDEYDVLTVGDGPTNVSGAPHLGVWQQGPSFEGGKLPLYEVRLVAGRLDVRVYAATNADLLHLLRELSPTVKDLHLATLAGILSNRDGLEDVVELISKAARKR